MWSPGVRSSLVVAVAGGVLLAGCDNSSENAPPPPSANASAPSAPKPAKAKLADQMVAAVSQGKAAAAVGVHFMLASAPQVNQDLPVEIAIVPHEKFTSLKVMLHGQEGINVVSGDSFGPKGDVEPEKAFTHELVLHPTAEGVFTIGATVETEGSEGVVSRDYAIPVIVAPPAAPAPGAAPATNPPVQAPAAK
jgi:hypothetical protein